MQLNIQRFIQKRKEQRYSQRQLAKAANVPYSTVSNIEAGRVKSPKYHAIVALASVLDAEPAYFFDLSAVGKQRAV